MTYLRALRRNAYGAAVALTAVCGAFEEGRYRPFESLCSNPDQQQNCDGRVGLGGGGGGPGSIERRRKNGAINPVSRSSNVGMGDSLNPGWKNGGTRSHKRRFKVRTFIAGMLSF